MQDRLETRRPLVSVIVPVYRAEPWLDRCVESICGQSYPHLEILLVDDGSPDACPRLCDCWAQRDSRIRVLHQKNGGLSHARNQGTALAAGDYISFVDADDYLAPDAVEYLLKRAEDSGADIACGGYLPVWDGHADFPAQAEEQSLCLTGQEAVRALLQGRDSDRLVPVWGKLYRSSLVRCNPFPVGRLHEDEAVTYRYFDQSGRVVLGSRAIYAYYQNPHGITHTQTRRNREDVLRSWEERCVYFARRGEAALAAAAADRFLNVLIDLADRGDAVCQEYLRDRWEKPLLRHRLRFKTRLRYWGWRHFRRDLNKAYHRLLGAESQ